MLVRRAVALLRAIFHRVPRYVCKAVRYIRKEVTLRCHSSTVNVTEMQTLKVSWGGR